MVADSRKKLLTIKDGLYEGSIDGGKIQLERSEKLHTIPDELVDRLKKETVNLVISLPSFVNTVTITSPFKLGFGHPYCLVIRPSKGSFLKDYQMYDDLHIGVTDSKGQVYDFDKGRVHLRPLGFWAECLVIDGGSLTFSTPQQWDDQLALSIHLAGSEYHGGNFNCFDFALGFLGQLGIISENLLVPKMSQENFRTAFTKDWILRPLEKSMKFAMLYRKLTIVKILITD